MNSVCILPPLFLMFCFINDLISVQESSSLCISSRLCFSGMSGCHLISGLLYFRMAQRHWHRQVKPSHELQAEGSLQHCHVTFITGAGFGQLKVEPTQKKKLLLVCCPPLQSEFRERKRAVHWYA